MSVLVRFEDGRDHVVEFRDPLGREATIYVRTNVDMLRSEGACVLDKDRLAAALTKAVAEVLS